MKEKETYRDNLEQLTEHFGGRRILTIPDVARYMGCAADVLYKDERFNEYTFKLNKQKRISTASLARYLT